MAAAALAGAMSTARKGKTAPLREQRHGRIDRRRLAKVAVGDMRVFTRRAAPAPDKVRVTILVDASASMHGMLDYKADDRVACVTAAAQICRDLADATEMLPWVTADVVAFTAHGDVDLYPLWKSGEATSKVDDYFHIDMSGTEEGYAIAFAMDEMLEHIQQREQGLIVIVSDGGPAEPKHVKSVVEMCRQHRIPVVSVALTESAAQPAMYGRDNVVKYHDNTRILAKDMAKVIGRVI
jgi:nitric oxide reductase activation protein